MKPVANLVIEMAANVARLEKDMAAARRSVDGAMQKIQRSAQMAMRALGALGLGLGGAQLTAFVRQAINAGDQMVKIAQQTGIATENIAGLQLAFRQGGASAAEMEMAVGRLVNAMNKQTDTFKSLNIQSKDTFGALSEVADLFQQMPDGAEKSALAYELFGRSGLRLIPILNQGSEGLRNYIKLSEQLGMVVTTETGKQFEVFNDTLDTVSAAMEGLANQAAIALIPTLQSLADTLLSLFTSGAVQRGVENLIEAMKLLGIVIAGRLIASIAGLTASLVGMASAMTGAAVATGGFTAALGAMRGVIALLGGPVGALATAAGALAYFTEKAYNAETTAEGLSQKLGMTNAELRTMTQIQVEQKIVEVALELQKLEIQAIETAAQIELLNNTLSDPEAYSLQGGQLSTELSTINKKSEAFRQILERLKQQLVESQKATSSTANGLSNFGKSADDAEDNVRKLIRAYDDETLMLQMTNRQKEEFIFLNKMEAEGIKGNTVLWNQLAAAYREAQSSRTKAEMVLAAQEADKKRLEQRIEAEKEFAEEAQRINDQIGQSLTDALMSGGMNAKDYLINMFKTLVLRPILQPIISGTLGAFGLGSAGAAIAGVQGGGMVGGGTDVLGLVGALKSGYDVLAGGFTAVGTAAAEFAASMQYGTALFSEQTAMLAAQEAGMATTVGTIGAAATVLAGVAAGLAAGSFISGQYSVFGDPIVATALGTAAGTAIGFAVGGPIGAAIGAFIGGAGGGLINRAFGQGPREVQAAGVTGTLSAGGANLQAFEQWKRSGGWFSSGSIGTDIRGLDPAMSAYFNQQAAAVGFGVATLAEQLGQSSDRIGEYSQSIRVSLLNLSDEEAQQRIAETFADFSNNLVNFLVPSIQFMTKEGETSTEALSRLATRLATVNSAFYTMGVELLDLSLNAGQAASNLVDLTGGIESFTQKTDFLYQNFYTQAERVAMATSQAAVVFERMGVAMPTTRDGFRELFQVIAGSGSASLTAAMLNIAPVMNDVISYTEQLEEAERQLADTIKNERLGLEREILQVLSDTVELRERELMALDESNRAMQAQLWMIEDAESALDAAINATDSALAKLEEALSAQLSNTLAELEANFNSLSDSLNRQIAATEAARDVANESIADLGNIFRLLDQEINSLLQNTLVAQTASQGLAFIAQALRTAQTTGYLPDREQLATAISAARGGLGSEQFGSSFEQRRATLVLANQLTQLRNITGDQMTTAERQLDIAEKQLAVLLERLQQAGEQYLADQQAAQDSFERQLEQAQNQINVLRDIDDSVFSVQQAIDFLALNISQERKSMIALQQQMIALQQDANQRAAAEAARIEAERIAELERQAAQQAALAEAQRKAQERADAEAAAAEADRLARETTAAQAAAAAKAEADRIAAAEAAKQKTIADYFLGDLFGGLDSTTNDANEDLYFNGNISENANGGYFGGGLSLVGEEGPELVNFARPSMIYTAGETAEILNGGGSTNAALANEVYQLRMENQAQIRAMVALQARMTRIIEQWDGDGLPTERYEGETA